MTKKAAVIDSATGAVTNIIVADAGVDACPTKNSMMSDVTVTKHFFPGFWSASLGFVETISVDPVLSVDAP